MLNSWLIICRVRVDQLVGATFKAVPLALAMSSILFWFVFSVWSSLSGTDLLDKTGVPPCYK